MNEQVYNNINNTKQKCFQNPVKKLKAVAQSAFTFSKITIKTLEQGVKYVQYIQYC